MQEYIAVESRRASLSTKHLQLMLPAVILPSLLVQSSGVGTRGAGGAGAPLKFVKGGLSPPEMNLFLVNTYLKVSLYILLTHAYTTV